MSKETTPTPEHPTDEELCGFMELTPQWWTRLKNAARDRNRLERENAALRKRIDDLMTEADEEIRG